MPLLYLSLQGGEPVKLNVRLVDAPLQMVFVPASRAEIAPTVIFTESVANAVVLAVQPKLVVVKNESFMAVTLKTEVALIKGVV